MRINMCVPLQEVCDHGSSQHPTCCNNALSITVPTNPFTQGSLVGYLLFSSVTWVSNSSSTPLITFARNFSYLFRVLSTSVSFALKHPSCLHVPFLVFPTSFSKNTLLLPPFYSTSVRKSACIHFHIDIYISSHSANFFHFIRIMFATKPQAMICIS